jgi:hypothetical protein
VECQDKGFYGSIKGKLKLKEPAPYCDTGSEVKTRCIQRSDYLLGHDVKFLAKEYTSSSLLREEQRRISMCQDKKVDGSIKESSKLKSKSQNVKVKARGLNRT